MNDVARQFLLVARHLRDPKTGLYYHAWDRVRQQPWADRATGLSKNFWGRAVGWYLMAARRRARLPAEDSSRSRRHHSRRAAARRRRRARAGPVSGVWWQVLDQPNRAGNYLEESGVGDVHVRVRQGRAARLSRAEVS